jgi:hypothetical protein
MRVPRLARLLPLAAMLSGCAAGGQYVVRGKIRGRMARGAGIVENASAVVTAEGKRDPTPAWVGRDGVFEATYRFGGRSLPFLSPGDGDPHVEISAPGYRGVRVRIRGDDAQDGVTRRACVPPAKRTYCMDVVLTPEAGGAEGRGR